jgi:hypothetical protein
MVVGRLQQRSWTVEDGSARSTVEVVAEELGPSLRWATAVRSYRSWPVLIESGPFVVCLTSVGLLIV